MTFRRYACLAAALAVLMVRTPAAVQNLACPHAGLYAVSRGFVEPVGRLNTLARFCAGMEVDRRGDLYDLAQTDDWTKFAAGENARWAAFKKTKEKVAAWAEAELRPHEPANSCVFYPFGGPDILYPCLLMPSAKLYVLVGLEPVGSPPDLEALRRLPLAKFLTQYSVALDDILRMSFFRRADLQTELTTPVVDGVLPIFMVLLARTEREIVSIERGAINPRGEFVRAGNDAKRRPRALRLRFRERRGPTHTLVYLSQDLSNPAVDSNRGFREFIEKNLSHGFGYIKSASYQMHKPVFSSIARLTLSVSDVILEDDSSIPYRLFDPGVWTITLYGTYTGPIDLFKEYFQQDLFDAYAKGAKPLDFHIGYGKKSNLLLAVRKAG
jgi:hypothetical protein